MFRKRLCRTISALDILALRFRLNALPGPTLATLERNNQIAAVTTLEWRASPTVGGCDAQCSNGSDVAFVPFQPRCPRSWRQGLSGGSFRLVWRQGRSRPTNQARPRMSWSAPNAPAPRSICFVSDDRSSLGDVDPSTELTEAKAGWNRRRSLQIWDGDVPGNRYLYRSASKEGRF